MSTTTKSQKESGYSKTSFSTAMYVYAGLVLLAWGIVPMLAKYVSLPGSTTAMVVNWSALVAVFIFMLVSGKLWQFKYLPKYWKQFTLIGMVWPLLYSISYFESIKQGSASLTTVLNYTWPLFAAFVLYKARGVLISAQAIVALVASVVILTVSISIDGTIQLTGLLPIILGIVAAATQGFFNIESSNEARYPTSLVWLMTFVGALVTAVGATAFTILSGENIALASIDFASLWPLVLIGAFSNGVGFWAFLKASKMSSVNDDGKSEQNFWLMMTFVPVVQVALLPIVGLEEIGNWRIIALIGICINFLVYRLWAYKSK